MQTMGNGSMQLMQGGAARMVEAIITGDGDMQNQSLNFYNNGQQAGIPVRRLLAPRVSVARSAWR